MFFMPISKLIRSLRQYNSDTLKLVKTPLIDSILFIILQFLKQKFSQINKRGIQIRSGGISENSKRVGRLLGIRVWFSSMKKCAAMLFS